MFALNRSKRSSVVMVSALFVGVLVLSLAAPRPARAHCDSEQGPVARAAHQALEKKDVKLILPYAQPQSEIELTAAFKQALEVRKAGGSAKELADRYFIETAIRLHRAGEGAPYVVGVTDETTPKAILVADKAMASGSLDETPQQLHDISPDAPNRAWISVNSSACIGAITCSLTRAAKMAASRSAGL